MNFSLCDSKYSFLFVFFKENKLVSNVVNQRTKVEAQGVCTTPRSAAETFGRSRSYLRFFFERIFFFKKKFSFYEQIPFEN